MKGSKPSKPKLTTRLREILSKEGRDVSKLERIATRRLGASPTPSPTSEFRPRGISVGAGAPFSPASTIQSQPGTGSTLQVETGTTVSRRKSSISLASTASGMKSLGDTFRKTLGEHNSLKSDYKTLLKLLDNLDYDGWKGLAAHLEQNQVKERLMETASSFDQPEDIRTLSHELIFRFVMVGFIKFLPSSPSSSPSPSPHPDTLSVSVSGEVDSFTGTGTGTGSTVDTDTESIYFVKSHTEFLATRHPAALLGVLILSDSSSELKKFEAHVEDEWGSTKLPEIMHESMLIIQKYTRRFSNIIKSLKSHLRYLLNTLVVLNDDHQYTNMSVITGYLPWVYYLLDPEVNERAWIPNNLKVDNKFWDIISDLYSDPVARWKAVQNIGNYYAHDIESNTVLHLMIYIWTMRKFGMDLDPQNTPKEVVGISSNERLCDCSEYLLRDFTPGHWQMQTYYICTEGDTITWALSTFFPENKNAQLVRMIIQNLDNWNPVKESSLLQLGMVRTLYIALDSCGVGKFLECVGAGEVAALGWHLGTYFRTHPIEYVTKKPRKSFELEKEKEKSPNSSPKSKQIRLDVDEDTAYAQINAILDKPAAKKWIIPSHSIPKPLKTDTPEERWKLKLRLSVAILKRVIDESPESGSTGSDGGERGGKELGAGTELFQALSALNVSEKLKATGLDDEVLLRRGSREFRLGSDSGEGEIEELDREREKEDTKVLSYLIRRLKESEERESVLEGADVVRDTKVLSHGEAVD